MFSISRNTIICSTFALAAAVSSAVALAKEGERHITLQEDVSSAELIRLNIPAGEIGILGTTGNNLTAEVTASCQKEHQDDCYQVLKDLGWDKKMGSISELRLMPSSITRYDHVTIKVKLGVPKDKKLEVNMSAGELHIEGTSACLTAELNAGQINITLKESQLASAKLHAKVGDVKLLTAKGKQVEGDRSLLVGASLEWKKGTGACHTKANILAGEVQLALH